VSESRNCGARTNLIRLARGGRGIVGGENEVVKAAQDEASPAALCRKTPEAQGLLLLECEGIYRDSLRIPYMYKGGFDSSKIGLLAYPKGLF
jgi:hypothetical protein